ncbi:MAG: diaminopropionate ammonia-lyase [Thermomicrobiales bacterium]|nr:diaminopropionate ammonia-lyase [Thermomicrobiales bacterium]
MQTPRTYINTHVVAEFSDSPSRDPLAFHRALAGYAPSRLAEAPHAAAALGIGRLLVKDESSRLGLPAFKILGAAWAIYRALEARLGGFAPWESLDDIAAQIAPLGNLTLVAATDGNHGRAVARMAALLGLSSRIYVPDDMVHARRDAIASEGAEVVVFHGTYDEAVSRSAEDADDTHLVISDTSWPGYQDDRPGVIDGYSTILWEVDDAAERDLASPDLVAVQIGVGALASAVVSHFRRPGASHPRIVGVEPAHAAGTIASMEAGEIVSVPGPHDSIMAGLNCGEPSMLAWPIMSRGIDQFVSVVDERAREAMRLLAADDIVAGETGAAGLAGLLDLLGGPDADQHRARLGATPDATALIIVTEGATDPAAYQQIIGG